MSTPLEVLVTCDVYRCRWAWRSRVPDTCGVGLLPEVRQALHLVDRDAEARDAVADHLAEHELSELINCLVDVAMAYAHEEG